MRNPKWSVRWSGPLLLIAIATVLRAWRLGEQVILGDELWSVVAGVWHPVDYLITQHHETNFSIVLALWNRGLVNTIGLEEWGLRTPVLLVGILTPFIAWNVSLRRYGRLQATVITLLFTVSPILVFYSRVSRPYGGVVLAVLIAFACWLDWLQRGRLRSGVVSVVAGGLAVFLNATATPAVAALWIGGVAGATWMSGTTAADGDSRVQPPRRLVFRSTILMASGTLLTVVLYAPSLMSFISVNADKPGAGTITLDAAWNSLHFLFGSRHDAILVWILLSAITGVLVHWQRDRLVPLIALSMAACQIGAVIVVSPHLTQWSLVLGRYLLPALPGLLFLIGAGLVWQARAFARLSARSGPAVATLANFALVGLIVAAGPLPAAHRGGAFMNNPYHFAPPAPPVVPERFPPIYTFLANDPETRGIVEVPWPRAFRTTPFGLYQARHRKTVTIATSAPLFAREGVRFSAVRPLSTLSDDSFSGDFVLIHHKVEEEHLYVSPGPHPSRGDLEQLRQPIRLTNRSAINEALKACRQNSNLHLVYEDSWLTVFARGVGAKQRVTEWLARHDMASRRSAGDRWVV